jgi:5'-3' exonuclease
MISDIGDDIVRNLLNGQINIDEFERDYNCSDKNFPYTPFQQLLSILPTKSIHLLPAEYKQFATQTLEKYFPADFDIDLNGRTLPWEAICLIPFVDDNLFLDTEATVKQSALEDKEQKRNTISFSYKCYIYDRKTLESKPKTTL